MVRAGVLDVALLESGPPDGTPVLLMHGFPYDIHAYDEVAPAAGGAGLPGDRALPAGLRTRRASSSGDAALGRAGGARARTCWRCWTRWASAARVLAGYDWGGRACLRRRGALAGALRGAGLARQLQHPAHRQRAWSRSRREDEAQALVPVLLPHRARASRPRRRTARRCAGCCGGCGRRPGPSTTPPSSEAPRPSTNPDFVAVVIHSYRHRYGLVPGDPAYADIEARLAQQPAIGVPAITLRRRATTACGGRRHRLRTRTNSPARTNTAWCPAPATTCRRKSREAFVAAVLDLRTKLCHRHDAPTPCRPAPNTPASAVAALS